MNETIGTEKIVPVTPDGADKKHSETKSQLVTQGIVRITLSIDKELDEYCKQHPEINKSAIFRQAMSQIRAGYEVQLSFYGLAFFILIAGCFLVLFWFIMPQQWQFLWVITLICVVVVILVKSVALFSQFNREVNHGL